jgi:cell division protein FtsB
MNLLPDQYVQRSNNRIRSSRVAIIIIVTLVAIVAIATHSRIAINNATEQLVVAQARANGAIEVESDASTLVLQKEELEKFVKKYNEIVLPFAMGELVATITNALPENITVEELSLDVLESKGRKIIAGHISGFGSSDESITEVVSNFQSTSPFQNVTMDFSRSRIVRGLRARGFRMSFSIDLSDKWEVHPTIADVGAQQ